MRQEITISQAQALRLEQVLFQLRLDQSLDVISQSRYNALLSARRTSDAQIVLTVDDGAPD